MGKRGAPPAYDGVFVNSENVGIAAQQMNEVIPVEIGFRLLATIGGRIAVKYDQALRRIVKRESDEDFESEHKFRIVKDNEFLLKHAAKVYTKNTFNKFKDEISEAFNYKVEEMTNADGFQSFAVKSKVNEVQKFTVTLDSQTYEAMNNLSEKLLKISSYVPPPINVCHEKDDLHSTEQTQVLLLDPNISQTKGRKKDVKGKDATIHSERLKSGIELALNKKKRKYNLCKGIGHDKRTCPENPMSKANKALEAEAQSSDSDQEMTVKHLDAKGLL
ncbi:hypothetical protein RHGRI_026025 [Rhododendron griersonianum]|uniref:Protein FAR1-RELATED SEQUENCE n=1 Tax=Rhododendron griersonianum TaxID=479676 RepID=A0AAV6IWQ9_9ERIC|nr:hypothetical protein RHGRI_026025 [Rhododendron griersonianum]